MAALIALAAFVLFAAGVVAWIIGVACVAIRREETNLTLTSQATDHVTRAARWLNGVGVRAPHRSAASRHDQIRRSLTSLTRRADLLLACRAAGPAAAAATRPVPPRSTTSPLSVPARTIATSMPRVSTRPPPPRERLRTRVLPARLPHSIQLCIHCQDRPAGFWVSSTGDQTVRRPWCLSCCEGLDHDSCDVVPFDP